MYHYDNKQHSMPHIHAKYGEYEAAFSIEDAELLSGSLPKQKLRMVQAWMEIHKEDLIANWHLATNGQTIMKIDPLR